MKKLMFVAAAAAMTSAFGVQVADYRASVNYVDMKAVQGVLSGVGAAGGVAAAAVVEAHLKYVEQANIAGYVVYNDCACNNADPAAGSQNPAWLVVTSDKATTTLPRVFPADLIVRMWDRSLGTANTVEAEGYLFAGKGKGGWSRVAPWMTQTAFVPILDNDVILGYEPPTDGYKFGHLNTYATTELFGMYNVAEETAPGVFGNFYESWMDHAGFGKGSQNPGQQRPCTLGTQAAYCLQTLQGNLIGGLFLCWENGHGCPCVADHDWFVCQEWIGTSDVICGEWAMRRFTNTPAAVALDEDVEPAFVAYNAVDNTETPAVKASPAAGMIGMLKAAVVAMRNFGCTAQNLGYLEDGATENYLCFGDTAAEDAATGANGKF